MPSGTLAAVTTRVARGVAALLLGGVLLAACGEEDFENKPRPPVPVDLSGVITNAKVTVAPAKLGAGPVQLTISNQTTGRHTVTLEGESLRAEVGPIGPMDTATIKRTLDPGDYEVRAGSTKAVTREIAPARLTIGKPRPDSNNQLLLP
jgi:hypothetical protein